METGEKVILGIILSSLIWAIFNSFTGAFVSDEKVVAAVEKQSYRNVKIKESHIFFVDWRGCSDDDDASYEMSVLNSNDQNVDILVCAGWPFKGVTVRTE